MQLHRHCYQKRVEVAGWWGRDLSFHTCLRRWHWDLYRHLHSIPQQAMPQSSHQETRCRKSTRMSTESQVSMKTFTAYCTMKCHHRTSDLGLRILSSQDSQGLMVPTLNPNMVFTSEAWRLWINSWYTINWKFKKRNLKQPKSGSCWSPLPRLPRSTPSWCGGLWGMGKKPPWITVNSSFQCVANTCGKSDNGLLNPHSHSHWLLGSPDPTEPQIEERLI